MTANIGHRQIEHTADLALEIWAPTEVELLVEAARAVVALITEGRTPLAAANRTIHIDAIDPEDRLVQWLNEIMRLALMEGFLFVDAQLSLPDPHLHAEIRGAEQSWEQLRTELKSATYHDLTLRTEPGACFARLVIDV